MKRLSLLLTACALIAALVAPRADAQVKLKGKPKIAFIYLGSISDGGWTGAQDRARLALQKATGQHIPYVENIPEQTEKAKQAAELFIGRGYNIIIGGTYGYSDAFLAEAKAHPDVVFVNMAGITTAPNLESPYPRTYQGWYLAGLAAGSVTKSKVLGMLEGFPIPDVLWDVNAFALGAKAANPGTVVKVAFVNSWSDPVKEGQLANAMLEQGADVIATDMDSPAALVQAEKAHKFAVGYQNDMSAAAPHGILTSVVFYWEKMLIPLVRQVAAGTWTSHGVSLYGIKDGVLDIVRPVHNVTPSSAARIDAMRQQIIAGTFSPFRGPITAQDGSVKVPAGQEMSVEAMWKMDYLVDNVRGSIK